ncbi:aminopeptidase N [Kineosporia sp. NBRC 101731]|uniref:aminopeptidase N n=1 Tax=Kineosporia sp. NBRC 101731 TaxID=3032199 RepID=UPI0024A08882|nr:aminopeptidase N [Kineosporia sp. NBRC 101731]GLY29284.1 aminopeptidase [Kineosporia sp. NBRC 101731]
MAGNLTRDEAAERSRLLTVHTYAVELDLTTGPDTFRSATVVRFDASRPGASTFAELFGANVLEASLNGAALPAGQNGRITLPDLAAENTLRVVADVDYSHTGQGLHRFTDPVDGRVYLHSQFATADAQRMFACFDQPDLKARYEFTVTAPADWEVVSNAAHTSVEEVAAGRRWRFAPTDVLSTYLAVIVAGPYHVATGEYRNDPLGTGEIVIPLRALCRQSLAPHFDADEILDVTRRGFDFYQAAFGMTYPFGKYDQAFVPEFNLGAMENPGCVTFTETYVFRSRVTDAEHERRASTILHEMAHMWFGDLVTMQWWDDLWLNESFATYAAALSQTGATRWTDAWGTFADSAKARAYRQDQLSTTHPIAADIPDIRSMEVNFDAITYQKGASVLKQLVATIGQETFLAALRRYFARHAWGTATLGDLLAALTDETGRDMSGWSAQWLETTGPNTLRADFTLDESGAFSSFAIVQSAPEGHPTLRSHRIAIGLYDDQAGEIVRRRRVELDVQGPRTQVPALLGQARGDLVLVNDDDLTYAKVRLDETSLNTVLSSIGRISDPLAQAVSWTVIWDLVRDAELSPARYAEVVMAGVGSVSNASVRRTLLAQAVFAVKAYVPTAQRPAALTELADGLLGHAVAAEPGSHEQLALVRAFVAAASSGGQLSVLEELLSDEGTGLLVGVVVDADLRWSLLLRLVATGRAGQERIDAELAADPTDKGRQQAAACSAAIPSVEAKTAAWQEFVAGEQPLNTLRWALDGFFTAEHTDLVEGWAQAYFDVLTQVADVWPSERVQTFARGAYPPARSQADLPALTEQYLAQAQPPAWLRRLVLEGRDEVVRARLILAG